VPKGWTKAKRAAAERREWKATAPRVENIAKIVLAALEGFIFLDAAPVSRLVLEKVYAGTRAPSSPPRPCLPENQVVTRGLLL
jgi:hypothetical protein